MDNLGRHKENSTHSSKQPVSREQEGEFAPSKIWKSRIGWRIILMVFCIIFTTQILVVFFSINLYEIEQLAGLKNMARRDVAQILHTDKPPASPFAKKDAAKLVTRTMVKGLAVYDMDYNVIETYGLPLELHPDIKSQKRSYHSSDGLYYEVLFTSREIGHPYNIAVKLDSSDVLLRIADSIQKALGRTLLLSICFTAIFMRALHQLFLAPVLRRNDEIMKRVYARNEDNMRKIAYFDSLTGLPNRTYFLEFLKESIGHKTPVKEGALAVMSIDLDNFKDINDAMGYEVGDKLLENVAQRLVKALPDNAVVARFHADEFAVMMSLQAGGNTDGSVIAEKILSILAEPLEIMQNTFLLRASIGISLYPHDGKAAYEILKNADIALNRAKAEGRAAVRYYSRDFDLIVQKRVQMLHDLRKAMDEKQLQLYYQPQFELKTGRMIGVEALLRWWYPDNSEKGGKFIPPSECISVAEQSGLIIPIGEYVLRTACAAARMWQDKGLPPVRMSVNISGVQFHRSDIVSLVAGILKETGLEPKFLELELTESIFMEDVQGVVNILDQLHQLGVEIAVDDFGTGYSSLSYLRRFPLDRLKIDQSFISAATLHQGGRMIVRAIINLARSLNLTVIAEGVETKDQEDLLKDEGCEEVQGFKYSKPIPPEEFWNFAVAYMKQNPGSPAEKTLKKERTL